MHDDRIVLDSKVHLGKPCVRGTRIRVEAILELVSASIPFDGICSEYYPDLTPEDVSACVEYARRVVQAEEIHAAGE